MIMTLRSGQSGSSIPNVASATGATTNVAITSTEALTQVASDGCDSRNGQLASISVGTRKLARRPITPRNTNTIGNARTHSAGTSSATLLVMSFARMLAMQIA